MKTGLRKEGGIYWRENEARMTLNTCANGPTIEMFQRLYMATKKPEYLEIAKNLDSAMNSQLRDPKTGLYWDNLGDDGKLNKAIYSYNQGTPVGADVQWYRLTGDKKYLDRATQTANAALDYYAKDDRLWKSSPAFNAIMFRNLLALDQVAPNPRIRATLEQYTQRLWTEGRDPRTGLFNRGGLGSYGGGGNTDVLDQGGVAQLFSLLSMTPEQLKKIA
jgi:rhamnogalacturonyl hydrolase YesR